MADPQTIQRIRRIAAGTTRVGTCLAFVATTTWAAFSVLHVNSLIAEFAYVLVVLVVAAKWGLAESFLTSVAAMLCLNYFFLPPILSLTIADPQNWVALFAFLVTAITASKLSSIARQRADEAQARRIEVEHLYQFSRSLMLIDSTRDLGTQIAGQVRLGDPCIGVRRFIRSSEEDPIFVGHSADSFFFVWDSTYHLFDNDGGIELSPRLGPWSGAGKIAFWKVMRLAQSP